MWPRAAALLKWLEGHSPEAALLLEIDISERLAVVVAHDEASCVRVLDRPGLLGVFADTGLPVPAYAPSDLSDAIRRINDGPAGEPVGCPRFWGIVEGQLSGMTLEESHARSH